MLAINAAWPREGQAFRAIDECREVWHLLDLGRSSVARSADETSASGSSARAAETRSRWLRSATIPATPCRARQPENAPGPSTDDRSWSYHLWSPWNYPVANEPALKLCGSSRSRANVRSAYTRPPGIA